MTENAASEETLGDLHAIAAKCLIRELSATDEDGNFLPVDPRTMTNVIRFLRDNKIEKNPFISEQISEIEKRLSQRARRFKVVPSEAAKRAAGE
jgi:(p)ppGpp synthase/HD superfamily hydrolase